MVKPPGRYQLNESSRIRDMVPGSDTDDIDVRVLGIKEDSLTPELLFLLLLVVEVVDDIKSSGS